MPHLVKHCAAQLVCALAVVLQHAAQEDAGIVFRRPALHARRRHDKHLVP